MKKVSAILAVVAVTLLFGACDVIEDPIIPNTGSYNEAVYGPPPSFGAPTSTLKNVLLEDFTAHQCGNCPDAGVIASALITSHPNRVALVAIHAGSLAAFDEASSSFNTNWITDEGEFYFNQLDFQANPLGRVNRTGGSGAFSPPTLWPGQTVDELELTAAVNMQIVATAIPEDNVANIHVHGNFASDYANSTNLVILITESELYDYQLWYGNDPEVVPDYHHKHVLRGSVTGALGLQFSPANASAGTAIQKDYTFPWNDAWVMENAHVVAFVVDNSTGEVLNVIEADL
jgi:hypothetical protein